MSNTKEWVSFVLSDSPERSYPAVMPSIPRRILLLTLFFLASIPVRGQSTLTSTASHTVRVGIEPITVIAVSGNPLPLSIMRDSGSLSTRDTSSHYNLTSNVDGVRIEAALDFPMPPGLQLRLRADTGLGRSRGFMNLNASGHGKPLVSSISRGLENGRTLEYELVVAEGVDPIPMQERRVTIAIVNPNTGFRQEVTQTVVFSVDEGFSADALVEATN